MRQLETATPWDEPGRQALRRGFRLAAPGTLSHAREGGWAIFLGRGTMGGVGRFLFRDGTIRLLTQYRQLDHLTDKRVLLPKSSINPATA